MRGQPGVRQSELHEPVPADGPDQVSDNEQLGMLGSRGKNPHNFQIQQALNISDFIPVLYEREQVPLLGRLERTGLLHRRNRAQIASHFHHPTPRDTTLG